MVCTEGMEKEGKGRRGGEKGEREGEKGEREEMEGLILKQYTQR